MTMTVTVLVAAMLGWGVGMLAHDAVARAWVAWMSGKRRVVSYREATRTRTRPVPVASDEAGA